MPHHSSSRRTRWLIAAVAVLAVVAVGLWWTNHDAGAGEFPQSQPAPSDSPSPTASPTARPSPTATATVDPEPAVEQPVPSGFPDAPDLPGLSGRSLSRDVPPLDLRITLTSASPIGTVGWVIPTSKDRASGRSDNVGRSWSLQTEVYGRPDYARLFLQSGATGNPITCVITVNGKVTERRATVGPYGALMCQG